MYHLLKIHIFSIAALALMLTTSCGTGNSPKTQKQREDSIRQAGQNSKPLKEQYAASIREAESKMKASEATGFDVVIANALIKSYLDYANAFPTDTLSADYLFRSGEIATSGGNYDQAVVLYKNVTDKYPNYKYYVEALYEQAMIFDSKLPGQTSKAKELYHRIIVEHPGNKLAADAQTAIDNLGKTDEELVREFEKKNHVK